MVVTLIIQDARDTNDDGLNFATIHLIEPIEIQGHRGASSAQRSITAQPVAMCQSGSAAAGQGETPTGQACVAAGRDSATGESDGHEAMGGADGDEATGGAGGGEAAPDRFPSADDSATGGAGGGEVRSDRVQLSTTVSSASFGSSQFELQANAQ